MAVTAYPAAAALTAYPAAPATTAEATHLPLTRRAVQFPFEHSTHARPSARDERSGASALRGPSDVIQVARWTCVRRVHANALNASQKARRGPQDRRRYRQDATSTPQSVNATNRAVPPSAQEHGRHRTTVAASVHTTPPLADYFEEGSKQPRRRRASARDRKPAHCGVRELMSKRGRRTMSPER